MKNTIFDMSKIDSVECVTITYQQGELETKIGYAPNLRYWSGTKHSTSRCGVGTLEELITPELAKEISSSTFSTAPTFEFQIKDSTLTVKMWFLRNGNLTFDFDNSLFEATQKSVLDTISNINIEYLYDVADDITDCVLDLSTRLAEFSFVRTDIKFANKRGDRRLYAHVWSDIIPGTTRHIVNSSTNCSPIFSQSTDMFVVNCPEPTNLIDYIRERLEIGADYRYEQLRLSHANILFMFGDSPYTMNVKGDRLEVTKDGKCIFAMHDWRGKKHEVRDELDRKLFYTATGSPRSLTDIIIKLLYEVLAYENN